LCLVALDAVRRTNFQALAATKAIIDQAQADYEAGIAFPHNAKAYTVINKAKAAQALAVNAMVKYEQLKSQEASAGMLATAQTNVETALADLPNLIASIKGLYITGGK
jgi:hypothetical protein